MQKNLVFISRPVFLILLLLPFINIHSQVFTKITDPSNPIVAEIPSGSYIGTSWVDVDNDERLDLFFCRKDIFKNLGNGNFIKIINSMPLQGNCIGNTWSDFDNDGDIDCFVVSSQQGVPTSHLYINNGSGMFTSVTSGVIGDSAANTGWGCAWGDFNNDGYSDLVIAAAFGFGGVNHPNRLLLNNTDGTFTRIDSTAVTSVNAPFTVPVWSDYDMDGDIDLFIGSGPASGNPARDFLYRNFRAEYSIPFYLQRIDTGIIGTDLVDGQNWNWIDYDNDGDMDAFLTNYSANVLNRLYRCEGPHYYVRMTSAQVGSIASDAGVYLANLWTDFDNDGDLDCFITRDNQTPRYYNNNGNGTFTRIDTLAFSLSAGATYGASAGDYDNDGDVDLFVAGGTNTKALYRNDILPVNKWVNIRCAGSAPAGNFSNKSALGTIIRIKALVNGNPTWQIREINAQNSFNSMNMLNVHFGLGNASVIDSIIIKWPRGLIQTFTNVAVNKFYKIIEGQGLNEIVIGIKNISSEVPGNFSLGQNYPNPFNPVTKIRFNITGTSQKIILIVYDITGKLVQTLVDQNLKPGSYEVSFSAGNLSSGIYFYTLNTGNISLTKKLVLVK